MVTDISSNGANGASRVGERKNRGLAHRWACHRDLAKILVDLGQRVGNKGSKGIWKKLSKGSYMLPQSPYGGTGWAGGESRRNPGRGEAERARQWRVAGFQVL